MEKLYTLRHYEENATTTMLAMPQQKFNLLEYATSVYIYTASDGHICADSIRQFAHTNHLQAHSKHCRRIEKHTPAREIDKAHNYS